MAHFVVHLGMAPSEYMALTLAQRQAIARVAKQRNQK